MADIKFPRITEFGVKLGTLTSIEWTGPPKEFGSLLISDVHPDYYDWYRQYYDVASDALDDSIPDDYVSSALRDSIEFTVFDEEGNEYPTSVYVEYGRLYLCISRGCSEYPVTDLLRDYENECLGDVVFRLSRNSIPLMSISRSGSSYTFGTFYSDDQVKKEAEKCIPEVERLSFEAAVNDLVDELRTRGYDCEEKDGTVVCTIEPEGDTLGSRVVIHVTPP